MATLMEGQLGIVDGKWHLSRRLQDLYTARFLSARINKPHSFLRVTSVGIRDHSWASRHAA